MADRESTGIAKNHFLQDRSDAKHKHICIIECTSKLKKNLKAYIEQN